MFFTDISGGDKLGHIQVYKPNCEIYFMYIAVKKRRHNAVIVICFTTEINASDYEMNCKKSREIKQIAEN